MAKLASQAHKVREAKTVDPVKRVNGAKKGNLASVARRVIRANPSSGRRVRQVHKAYRATRVPEANQVKEASVARRVIRGNRSSGLSARLGPKASAARRASPVKGGSAARKASQANLL